MSTASSAFAVEGELSIYRASELAQALLEWWPLAEAAGAVQLDLGQVSEIDGAGLQLLLAAQRTAQAQGLRFQLTAASDAVAQLLQMCALQDWLPPVASEPAP